MNNALIGKTIKFQVGNNGVIQTGTVLDVSINGSINISGNWYQQNNIIIVEINQTSINENQQLILG